MTNYDLNKLLAWARENFLSLDLYYDDSCGDLSIRTIGAGEPEDYAQKRVTSVESFIEYWNEHFNEQMKVKKK